MINERARRVYPPFRSKGGGALGTAQPRKRHGGSGVIESILCRRPEHALNCSQRSVRMYDGLIEACAEPLKVELSDSRDRALSSRDIGSARLRDTSPSAFTRMEAGPDS